MKKQLFLSIALIATACTLPIYSMQQGNDQFINFTEESLLASLNLKDLLEPQVARTVIPNAIKILLSKASGQLKDAVESLLEKCNKIQLHLEASKICNEIETVLSENAFIYNYLIDEINKSKKSIITSVSSTISNQTNSPQILQAVSASMETFLRSNEYTNRIVAWAFYCILVEKNQKTKEPEIENIGQSKTSPFSDVSKITVEGDNNSVVYNSVNGSHNNLTITNITVANGAIINVKKGIFDLSDCSKCPLRELAPRLETENKELAEELTERVHALEGVGSAGQDPGNPLLPCAPKGIDGNAISCAFANQLNGEECPVVAERNALQEELSEYERLVRELREKLEK